MNENFDPLLRWFDYVHLPLHLQKVSKLFAGIAINLCEHLPASAERTVALRKLLEAKDAAVRAAIDQDTEQKAEANHSFPSDG